MIIYTIETVNQVPITDTKLYLLAVIKCLLIKNACYVFKFYCDQNDDYELIDCVFNKRRITENH